jgi:hypothetical protein
LLKHTDFEVVATIVLDGVDIVRSPVPIVGYQRELESRQENRFNLSFRPRIYATGRYTMDRDINIPELMALSK